MRQSLAISVPIPSPDEVGDAAKTVAAVGGVVGGAWALIARWRRRCREAQERRALEGKAVRYLLDAMRHTLHVVTPTEERRFIDLDELARQKVLVDQIRDQLWICDGHKSDREAQRQTEEIVRVLTRTQRIKAKEQRNNPFADGWTPDEGK